MKAELNTCSTCEHKDKSSIRKPCADCIKKSDFINWELPDWVNKLIKEAKKKAFEAGIHKGLEMIYKDYIDVENEYNQWKEAK